MIFFSWGVRSKMTLRHPPCAHLCMCANITNICHLSISAQGIGEFFTLLTTVKNESYIGNIVNLKTFFTSSLILNNKSQIWLIGGFRRHSQDGTQNDTKILDIKYVAKLAIYTVCAGFNESVGNEPVIH